MLSPFGLLPFSWGPSLTATAYAGLPCYGEKPLCRFPSLVAKLLPEHAAADPLQARPRLTARGRQRDAGDLRPDPRAEHPEPAAGAAERADATATASSTRRSNSGRSDSWSRARRAAHAADADAAAHASDADAAAERGRDSRCSSPRARKCSRPEDRRIAPDSSAASPQGTEEASCASNVCVL